VGPPRGLKAANAHKWKWSYHLSASHDHTGVQHDFVRGLVRTYSIRRDADSSLDLDLKETRDFEKQQVVETGWAYSQ
jgi:hypothetical protein